jgi:TolB-like protein/DNA-binding winged helix-turn-helix (wHTH) protein/Tfp pilus assembly protein PilF
MVDTESTSTRYRFGIYEISVRRGELRKDGLKVKLQEKPFQVLALLVEKAGQTVTREQFRRRLWPAETTVDFDSNLNTALTKVRQALDESAENPRFVETVPRLGYRFLAPVLCLDDPEEPGSEGTASWAAPAPAEAAAGVEIPEPLATRAWLRQALFLTLLLLAGTLGGFYVIRAVSARFATGPAPKPVLVVLPFANLSGDPSEEFFSDGLTDELITQIGNLNPDKLSVIARTSAMHYKGTRETVEQIGRELGANYALEGTVRRSGGRVHVTAQLVQTRGQTRLWAHTYESGAGDLLQLQSDVANNVAGALAVELLPGSRGGAAAAALRNPEAYEKYLEGRLYWNKHSPEGLKKASELFYQALQEDHDSALAYSGLADTFLAQGDWMLVRPDFAFPRARQSAEKALALDDSLGSAHAVLATVSWEYEKNWKQAESEFQRAIALDPANARARQSYAEYLSSLGRHNEALAELSRAHSLDPLSLNITADRGNLLYFARRYDQAIEACKKALQADPNFIPAYAYLGRSYVASGRFDEALEAREKFLELNGEPEAKRSALRHAVQTGGIRAGWQWGLDDMKKREAREYVCPFEKALYEARLGYHEAALADLEKSYEIGDGRLVWIKVDPALDPLRKEPRFKNLLGKLQLES